MEKMDGKSMDIVAENVAKLRELFPEAFTEGKVDFAALKEVLGTFVETQDERYSFTWNGKSKARMIAQTPSTGTLRPCKDESVDWETTRNIFIEGDNLEVLKLLQKSYHKKVKMIYIDPPYNTGNDFVYKDNFKDNIKNYKEITGQVDGEGRNLSNNPETSGRYHTDWLNMMYPRLKLSRNLLKDDGVIFISIDDNEVSNLRKMCNEIFGEENFVGNTVRASNSTKNNSNYVSITHDYCLIYAKSIECVIKNWKVKKRNVDDFQKVARRLLSKGLSSDEKSEAFKSGYKTIVEISKERIRRAAAKIKEENQPQINTDKHGSEGDLFDSTEKNLCPSVSICGSKNLDLGFKVFKLDSTNIKPWEVDFDMTERTLEDFISNIKTDRREEDVLYEVLLKYGLDLTLPITKHTISGKKVFDIGMGALIICLSDAISLEVAEGIAKLKDEFKPEIMRVVFKDSGFKNDVVKTNAVQILKQAGIVDVRSL